MENNKKIVLSKSKCIIFIAVVIICIAITFILASHSTYYKYNDWWIIGKTYDQVEERYGEFDITFGTCRGYYIGDDDGRYYANVSTTLLLDGDRRKWNNYKSICCNPLWWIIKKMLL